MIDPSGNDGSTIDPGVVLVRLVHAPPIVRAYWGVLSPAERDRATRYATDHLRERFIVRRGVLRCLLGRFLGLDPTAVVLTTEKNGKPGTPGIEFNCASSGDLAIYAFASETRIGVDLEQVRPFEEMRSVAERFFAASLTEIGALPSSDRSSAFFRTWTRAEAYLKATGEGLTGLEAFGPGGFGDQAVGADWRIVDVEVPAGFVAAVASQGGLTNPRARSKGHRQIIPPRVW